VYESDVRNHSFNLSLDISSAAMLVETYHPSVPPCVLPEFRKAGATTKRKPTIIK
jgi:hypothetical protein